MLDAASAVELRVKNISREDCRRLEEALSALFKWRREQPAQADVLQAQLMSGSLRLDVGKLVNDGVLEWMDTLRPAQPLAAEVELQEEPRYDRCDTGELLAPPVVDNTLLLPGGVGAAQRRQAAQAAAGDWTESADNPLAKRRRVGLNKCHNCGSYKHGVSKCPVKVDQRRVQASMAQARAERGPAPDPISQLRLRYFDMPAGAARDQRGAARPTPGVISAELAEALGMPSSTAPAPWLSRMAVLGVPPRYAEQNEEQEGEGPGGAGEQLMVFFRGSEDEEEEEEAAEAAGGPDIGAGEESAGGAAGAANGLGAAAAAAADADAGGGGGAGVNGAAGDGSSSSSSDGDDFIPFAGDGEAATGQQEQQQQGEQPEQQQGQQEQQPPPLHEAVNGEADKAPAQEQQQQAQQQQQQQERQANGAAHARPPKLV